MVFRGPTIGGESKECVLSAFSDLFEHGTPALKKGRGSFFNRVSRAPGARTRPMKWGATTCENLYIWISRHWLMTASLTPIFKGMPREQSKKKLFVTTLQNLSFPMVFRSLQSRPRGDTLRFFVSFKEMPLAVPHASNEPVHRWNMLQAPVSKVSQPLLRCVLQDIKNENYRTRWRPLR